MWHLHYVLAAQPKGKKDIAGKEAEKVQHFDSGGQVGQSTGAPSGPNGGALTTTGHDGRTPGQVWSGGTNSTIYGAVPGVNAAAGWVGNSAAGVTHALGDTVKGIGSAFTVQNQYQAGLAPEQQSNYQNVINQSAGNALNGQNEYFNNQAQQQNVANQMQGTADQYQNIANGVGPNPAMNQLNQTTGANNANVMSQLASQRGTSRNPGAVARQGAMAGAMNQQTAAGQGATLRSQQQLAGLSALQGQQQNMGSLYGQMGTQVQGEQGVNAGLFGTAATAQNQQNANSISNYGMMQGINSQIAQNNANAANKTTAGFMDMAGKAAMMMAEGGEVKDSTDKTQKFKSLLGNGADANLTSAGSISTPYASNFSNANALQDASKQKAQEPQKKKDPSKSDVWNHLNSDIKANKDFRAGAPGELDNQAAPNTLDPTKGQPTMFAANGGGVPNLMAAPDADDDKKKGGGIMGMLGGMMATGGKVPAMVSPGEKYLNPREAHAVAKGKATPAQVGKMVPGKAKVKGNSYKNDTVPATLEEGGIVIPRSVMESDNPMKHSIAFVRAHMSKTLRGKKK